jgi:hypothetical protein
MRRCTSSIPSTSLLDSLSFEDLGGVKGLKIPPNLSPAIRHTIIAGTMLSLNGKLYLTLVEMHAVMMAFSAIAGAPFFVARAAKTVKDLPRGVALGHTLASVAIADWEDEGSGSRQPQRYNMYFKVASSVPPLDVFISNVMKSVRLSLFVWRDHSIPPNGGIELHNLYKRIQSRLSLHVANFGVRWTGIEPSTGGNVHSRDFSLLDVRRVHPRSYF